METKLYLTQEICPISLGRVFVVRFIDIVILLYDFLEKLLCCSLSLEEISYFLFCNIILCYKDPPLSKYKVKKKFEMHFVWKRNFWAMVFVASWFFYCTKPITENLDQLIGISERVIKSGLVIIGLWVFPYYATKYMKSSLVGGLGPP